MFKMKSNGVWSEGIWWEKSSSVTYSDSQYLQKVCSDLQWIWWWLWWSSSSSAMQSIWCTLWWSSSVDSDDDQHQCTLWWWSSVHSESLSEVKPRSKDQELCTRSVQWRRFQPWWWSWWWWSWWWWSILSISWWSRWLLLLKVLLS